MSSPFEITAQALTRLLPSTLNLAILAPRSVLKPKPLAEWSLYNLQFVRHDPIIMSATTDSLLAQFKANTPAELDSDYDNSYDIH
jgi:hypothetical protein